MINVTKDLKQVPTTLNKENRKKAFEENIKQQKYKGTTSMYKIKSVQNELIKIYNCKCAFCETKLLDAPKHIEHYRPKDHYYWLAYSWDNLLLSCGSCNSTKNKHFKTQNNKVTYNNEKFENIHSLRDSYDTIENPYIINPEKEDILQHIKYDKNAKVYSDDIRVSYTIDIGCKLNRNELLQKRVSFVTDFKNSIDECTMIFKKEKKISIFVPTIKGLLSKCNTKEEYYSLKHYMQNNINEFVDNKAISKVVNAVINKLRIGAVSET